MTSSSTDAKAIRKFGGVAFFFFGILCALAFWRHKTILFYFFGFLSLLGLGFIVMPNVSKPVYDAWLKIAHFIGKVITTVALTLLYYLIITPTALLKMVFGGRPLPLKPDKGASSYWVERDEPAQPKERFIKRY